MKASLARRELVSVAVFLALVLGACGGGGEGSSSNAPVANAGEDRTSGVRPDDVVVLDGSASSDPNGDALHYLWSLVTVPPGSTVSLSDPFSDKPHFTADKEGIYVARLIVNDGQTESAPDTVNVTAAKPAPTVAISTPESGTILAANPVTVSGTVDDPLATVKVQGIDTANNNGSYSANVVLAEGNNTVTVVATNNAGEGRSSVDVTFKGPGPAISIQVPKPDFTVGLVFESAPATSPDIPVFVSGFVLPNGGSGTPTVRVNNVLAAVAPHPTQGFSYEANIALTKGPQTITVEGIDTLGATTTQVVNGVADYCIKLEEDSAPPTSAAERGTRQNIRCHEIDGCNKAWNLSADPDTNSLRNLPMPNAVHAAHPVVFGSGYLRESPLYDTNDFFVHGLKPRASFGCNNHDLCYQTCVPPEERDAHFRNCNENQEQEHKNMCRSAYPSCPYTGFDSWKCIGWLAEKGTCFSIANIVRLGVGSGQARDRFDVRQKHYCLP